MRTTTYVTRLDHSPEAVSAFLGDLRNDAKWRQEITAVDVVSGLPGEPATVYRETVTWEGAQTQVSLTASEVVPGSRLVVSAHDAGYESVYEYQFTPLDGGTEVTVFMSIDTTGAFRLIEPLMWNVVTRWVERDLPALDAAMEAKEPVVSAVSERAPDTDVYEKSGETSRAFLGEVVDSLAEGIVLFSDEGRIFYANRAVEETLGVPHASILGRRFDDPAFSMRTGDGREVSPEESPFMRVKNGEVVRDQEYRLKLPGALAITISVNATPLRIGGELAGVALSATDVTERVRTESRLRESEERFRAIVEQSRYGIVISSVDGEVLVYNHAMEEINGHSFEEVKRLGWLRAAFPDEDDRRHIAELAKKSAGGELPYVEAPYTRPDGRRIWVSYSSSPIRLRGKDYIFSIVSDITERRHAESRVRFQSRLLDEVRNAVVATDKDGHINYVNDEARRLFGIGGTQLMGQDIMGLLRPRAAGREHEVMSRVMTGGHWEGEATFVLANGHELPVLLTLGLLADEKGDPEGFVGVAADISDMKAAERELEERDRAIRQAYVDVVGAVTGGRLILLTPDELGGWLGEAVSERMPLRSDNLADSRHAVRDLMADAHIAEDPGSAIVAYGEAAANALKHAGSGWYQLFRKDGVMQVVVDDEGPGIDFRMLPKATLLAGFSSTQTLGMGFSIMLDLADRVLLATAPGCTRVALEFSLAHESS